MSLLVIMTLGDTCLVFGGRAGVKPSSWNLKSKKDDKKVILFVSYRLYLPGFCTESIASLAVPSLRSCSDLILSGLIIIVLIMHTLYLSIYLYIYLSIYLSMECDGGCVRLVLVRSLMLSTHSTSCKNGWVTTHLLQRNQG